MDRDKFFEDFERGSKRTFAKAGCLVILLNILWVLFLAAVIIGGIYAVVHFVL